MDRRTPVMGMAQSIAVVCLALCGAAASVALLMSEITALGDPAAQLACDVNPLIGCSASLQKAEAHLLFGVPNAVFGTGLFLAMAALGLVGAMGGGLPRPMWWLMMAGTAGASCLVVWFLTVSITRYRTLCPYCMVVWAAALALLVIVWTRAADLGLLGSRLHTRSASRYAWLGILAVYLLIVLVIVVTLSDKIALVM